MIKMLRTSIILFFLVLCFVACDSNQVFDEYKSLPDKWHKDSIIGFKVTPPDSINNYNLFVNIRNTNAYKYNNIFLIVEMINPHGKRTKDTLEYKMADPTGKLLGTGLGLVKENKLWYKGMDSKFKFDEDGDYIFRIQHAMRERAEVQGLVELEGITDVGFRVESVNKK